MDISYLLFASDALIFSRAVLDHLQHIWYLFLCFEVVSGLKVNLAKVSICSRGRFFFFFFYMYRKGRGKEDSNL